MRRSPGASCTSAAPRSTRWAPRDRGIAMVFQNYALYPHMTVEKNIGYGLKNMKMPADQIKKKVDWGHSAAGPGGVPVQETEKPFGGQRQRVALGRAIVKNQKVFLMDEPLSNLDAKLRVSMRDGDQQAPPPAGRHYHLRNPRPGGGHDHGGPDRYYERRSDPAGRKAMELYDHPKNQFVAGFIGSPQMNFLM